MITYDTATELAAFFKMFSDETRIRILSALHDSEMCVNELCQVLNMTKSAVSHQLNSLRREHLVRFRREGRNLYYTLDDEHIKTVFETGLEHIRHTAHKDAK